MAARFVCLYSITHQRATQKGLPVGVGTLASHVAHHMNTLDAVGSVLDEDGKGGYCFDRMAFKDPFDILGFFLGYMSGPILAESAEEQQERMKHVVMVPEEAYAIGIAL